MIKNLVPLKDWHSKLKDRPVIISGPCSAESEEQVLQTARKINELNKVAIFRAGIWKPRTSPSEFEGIGKIGLKWLDKVKNETDLLVAIEVANKEHVRHVLKSNVDILWIGARTTSNPFAVQEIAQSLKGTDIPILIKNPINPDIDLWVGAIERFRKQGIFKIAAIHRGFYPFERTEFRNIPKWEIPLEIKRRFFNLSLVCDPSHIAGSKDFIKIIAQRALDLDMDGLMIECHIDPEKALSDSKQQVTPNELKKLLSELVFRKSISKDKIYKSLIHQYREEIDAIDYQLLSLLSQRLNIIEKIGMQKSDKNIAIFQIRRWKEIMSSRLQFAKGLGLSEDFIKKIVQLIHEISIQKQVDIFHLKGINKKRKK